MRILVSSSLKKERKTGTSQTWLFLRKTLSWQSLECTVWQSDGFYIYFMRYLRVWIELSLWIAYYTILYKYNTGMLRESSHFMGILSIVGPCFAVWSWQMKPSVPVALICQYVFYYYRYDNLVSHFNWQKTSMQIRMIKQSYAPVPLYPLYSLVKP